MDRSVGCCNRGARFGRVHEARFTSGAGAGGRISDTLRGHVRLERARLGQVSRERVSHGHVSVAITVDRRALSLR